MMLEKIIVKIMVRMMETAHESVPRMCFDFRNDETYVQRKDRSYHN